MVTQNGAETKQKEGHTDRDPIRRKAWTDEDEQTLLEMKTNGKTTEEIADALGRTKSAIQQRLSKINSRNRCPVCGEQFKNEHGLNIHVAKSKDEAHQKLRQERKSTTPPVQQEEKEGHNEQSEKIQRRRWSKEEEQKLLQLKESGKTVQEMAAELDRTDNAIKARLSDLNRRSRCSVCEKQCKNENGLKIHIAKSKDDAHQKLRGHSPEPGQSEQIQRKRWSQEEDKNLLQWRTSQTAEEMAEKLGRTKSAVQQRLSKLDKELEEKKSRNRCEVCGSGWETEKGLKIHIANSKDEKHQKLRRETTGNEEHVQTEGCREPSNTYIEKNNINLQQQEDQEQQDGVDTLQTASGGKENGVVVNSHVSCCVIV